ncbi:MAG: tyrosine-protein phosphatase, partial [Novosphingobium sp.]|uniref:tyrosine-protein phosphatase n=1 Tax=Novosphingobium sp. TaxID=1874826 RepID=UPI003B9B1F87
AGADYLVLDVAADSTKSLGGDMRQAMAQIASGKGEALLIAANREFVTLPSARKSYATLIRTMIAADGPVIYHCTAGKDRTGWASAVVLGLLGVPGETVMQDYLLSNTRLEAKNAATLAAVAKSGHPINPAFLEPVLIVKPAYIEAAFAEVERVYGSLDAYATKGLGLTPAEIEALKAKFLTPPRE